jgi:hypothetical protein
LESVTASKKYMIPLVCLHPYIGGGLLVEYFGHRRFDPARNALVLDSENQLGPPMTRDDRVRYQSRLDEMSQSAFVADAASADRLNGDTAIVDASDAAALNADASNTKKTNGAGTKEVRSKEGKDLKAWERLEAGATLGTDTAGQPVLQLRLGDDTAQVGISRANILSVSDSSELAARLVEARLRQELRPATARKTSPSDVERDLALLQYLLSLPPKEIAGTPSAANLKRALATADVQ